MLLVLLLVLPAMCAPPDGCVVLQPPVTLYSEHNETFFNDLSNLFRGFNLYFSLNGEYKNNYTVLQPIRLINATGIPYDMGEGMLNVMLRQRENSIGHHGR